MVQLLIDWTFDANSIRLRLNIFFFGCPKEMEGKFVWKVNVILRRMQFSCLNQEKFNGQSLKLVYSVLLVYPPLRSKVYIFPL